MHNVILRTITVTNAWQSLADRPLIGSVTISTPPSNAATVLLRSTDDPANEVFFVNGEWHDFQRIDLSTLQVKGTSGDKVTVIGGTW
mgnify:CR=1 FL=1